MQVGVVVPFFQHAPGLLRRAVSSALSQREVQAKVVVVDDGSPVRAADELGEFGSDLVELVWQRNSGPAAARNTGLDHLPEDTSFVAFLDSDDTWDPGHLRNALAAMEAGADFYFCDWQREGEASTRFAQAIVVRPTGEPLGQGDCLFRYQGDLFDAVLRCSPVGTPGVVFRREIAPSLRFRPDLRTGEDDLFWMALTKAARMIVYTTKCEAFCGRGVSIVAGAKWRDPRALVKFENTARKHRIVRDTYVLTDSQARWNEMWRAELRRSYALNLLAMLWHRESIDWPGFVRFAGEEPRLLLSIGSAAVRRATGHRPSSASSLPSTRPE
jgi:succinoglycan biosynthesis protein ExoW